MKPTDGENSNVSEAADELTPEEFVAVTEMLERLANDRGLLTVVDAETRHRLLKAAGTVAFPGRAARRKMTKALRAQRQVEKNTQKDRDQDLLAGTGIRAQFRASGINQACPSAPFDTQLPPAAEITDEEFGPELTDPRNCYICKRDFRRLHHFYDSLCPDCAQLNWTKRHQTADASGRYSLVTGGRVKIGYQAALKLLRAGSHVIVTTRFPRDAARRFLTEKDNGDWHDRLSIYGMDLRHTPSVEALCSHLNSRLPRLDFILNNACQTVRRPPGFYGHLMEGERQLANALPREARRMLDGYEELRSVGGGSFGKGTVLPAGGDAGTGDLPAEVADTLLGIQRAAELSQIPMVKDDHAADQDLFPEGKLDHDLQQVDLRKVNSWRLKLAEVPTVELLEVHLVNAVAPFILNARLKPLMLAVATRDKHIVNVSAMEGIFYRAFKTDKHPHTNMAKASLNMLTRTSAQDYARDGIHMNSVDTGWITDEDPVMHAERKQRDYDFHPPLDIIDAAARICDPFLGGLLSGEHVWGKFLKDYQVANW